MTNTVNMSQVFNTIDAKRAAAEATIARYTVAQVAEASRVALIYDRCDTTSAKHKIDTARFLVEIFGEPIDAEQPGAEYAQATDSDLQAWADARMYQEAAFADWLYEQQFEAPMIALCRAHGYAY